MQDNFSTQSELYTLFRPGYPNELIDFLLTEVSGRSSAWDCGTGNGQLAVELAAHFQKVHATDISEKQIGNAVRRKNIEYAVETSEHTTFPDEIFDLITVAQAVHWFDFHKFYREVNRTLKPDGILAIIGYGLCAVDEQTDAVIHHLYNNILRSYWDKERKHIDAQYKTVPFPFTEIHAPSFSAAHQWTADQMIGFLNSWSAVQHYLKKNGQNPLDLIEGELRSSWTSGATKSVRFPIFVRLGKKTNRT